MQCKTTALDRRRAGLALTAGLVALALLAGCGKKGDPEAPGERSYPRTYPTQ